MPKYHCASLAAIMHAHGVTDAVLCPGSRDAAIITAIERSGHYRTHVVVDERSAAFIALGLASASGHPVAVVCTSGSALLNFAPAAAEAYYRRIPLILISADRPAEWIDQDDSQTIRQPGALANIVRFQADIHEPHTSDEEWYAARAINDACIAAAGAPVAGPVHINIRINEPISEPQPEVCPPIIRRAPISSSTPYTDTIARAMQGRKVLAVVGFMPSYREDYADIIRLAHTVPTLVEAQSNLAATDSSRLLITRIDATLRLIRDAGSQTHPDLVITMGGALLSRHLKKFLRSCPDTTHHIHVGLTDCSIDCFQHLRLTVPIEAHTFCRQLLEIGIEPSPDYLQLWQSASRQAEKADALWSASTPWSDYCAMRQLFEALPHCHLHLSNGTAVRYAQLFDYRKAYTINSNRGVSGIDGSTSTAIGEAIEYSRRQGNTLTILISGDMSAQYDLGALATESIPPSFRIVVLSNSGGGIFRFIPTTSALPELERNFCGPVKLPLRGLADAFGFDYFEASSSESLAEALPGFLTAESARPAILNIITPPQASADTLKAYFSAGR